MAAFERRALQYRKGGKIKVGHDEILHNEALDETGTVSTECLADSDAESWNGSASAGMAEALEAQELAGVVDELLEVQGVAPGKKTKELHTRLVYENVDGLRTGLGATRSCINSRT